MSHIIRTRGQNKGKKDMTAAIAMICADGLAIGTDMKEG